ncbi:ubiquitin-specific protease 26 [Actinidia rufa]|uniref:Ubiquitin-specific protease 26 n=1 Tax=Actinidia rufa TaxID=165716 RepID=A0A7J0FQB0_9ERIC|nr:ubiquitin-specific protease 26 [Actinidia rufa]
MGKKGAVRLISWRKVRRRSLAAQKFAGLAEVDRVVPGLGDGAAFWVVSFVAGVKGTESGKKIVITGVVISSAPLVLPLLVVISALGFAVSVPFGLIFASYACTEKLMSKLLPGLKSPLMLEEIEEKEVGFDGDMMEEDEKYQMEDVRGWDEMGMKKDIEYCWRNGRIWEYNGGPTLAKDDYCVDCLFEVAHGMVSADSYRDRRTSMKELADAALAGNCLDGPLYYVSKTWLQHWIRRKNIDSPCEADAEPTASIRCPHGDLKPEQATGAKRTDLLTIITENDWKLFCEDWSGTEERGISAEIEVSNCMEDDTVGVSAEMPISEEHMNTHDEINGETESKQFMVKTRPEVCEDCIGERESCELMKKLNYCNEDICVCFVRGKEPPRSILEASGNILEPDRRTSKRSRKTSFGNSINLNVSGSTSIYQLKMMIWESFGVVKENQILHKGSRVIDGESATLADMNIFPGDILWVTDSEIHENRDIADELSDHKIDVQQAEEGFRGTLLTSNISSQDVHQILPPQWELRQSPLLENKGEESKEVVSIFSSKTNAIAENRYQQQYARSHQQVKVVSCF